jgi:hypothetical protein
MRWSGAHWDSCVVPFISQSHEKIEFCLLNVQHTEGFSGHVISKLAIGQQVAAYKTEGTISDKESFFRMMDHTTKRAWTTLDQWLVEHPKKVLLFSLLMLKKMIRKVPIQNLKKNVTKCLQHKVIITLSSLEMTLLLEYVFSAGNDIICPPATYLAFVLIII